PTRRSSHLIIKKELISIFFYKILSFQQPFTNNYQFYLLNYNKNTTLNITDIWDHHRRIMFHYSIQNYDYCINNNGYDETQTKLINFLNGIEILKNHNDYPFRKQETADYPKWLLSYIQQMVKVNIDSIEVIKLTASYDKDKVIILDQQPILSYKK